jgi:hypothetical protein
MRRILVAFGVAAIVMTVAVSTADSRRTGSTISDISCNMTGKALFDPPLHAADTETVHVLTGVLTHCDSGIVNNGTFSARLKGDASCYGDTAVGEFTIEWDRGGRSSGSITWDLKFRHSTGGLFDGQVLLGMYKHGKVSAVTHSGKLNGDCFDTPVSRATFEGDVSIEN